MPEILTKHPTIVREVLESSPGVRCGRGLSPQILTTCPPKRFCRLPGGELCIYDLETMDQMIQINWNNLKSKLESKNENSKNTRRRKCSLCGQRTHIASNQKYHPSF